MSTKNICLKASPTETVPKALAFKVLSVSSNIFGLGFLAPNWAETTIASKKRLKSKRLSMVSNASLCGKRNHRFACIHPIPRRRHIPRRLLLDLQWFQTQKVAGPWGFEPQISGSGGLYTTATVVRYLNPDWATGPHSKFAARNKAIVLLFRLRLVPR
jgi:hypothetical protein